MSISDAGKKNRCFLKSHRTKALIVLALGFLCLGAGVYRGEVAVVLTKAIHICLECIGIG